MSEYVQGSIDDFNSATVGIVAGQVLAAALSRCAMILVQSDPTNTVPIALRFGAAPSAVTDNHAFKLAPGASLTFSGSFMPSRQALYAIAGAAAQNLTIWVSE